MLSYYSAGRIPRDAAFSSSLALFVLAMVAVTLRFAIRFKSGTLRLIEDGFMMFAALLLITCMGLWFSFLKDMYIDEALLLDEITVDVPLQDAIPVSLRLHKLTDVFLVLTWTALFAVKFTFLYFFRGLIDRVRHLIIFWRFVVGFTAIIWVAGCVCSVVACPYYDKRVLTCAKNNLLQKTQAISGSVVAFNIITDLLILAFPILILRKVSIATRSKILLGISMGLSTMMVMTTIIRVSGLKAQSGSAVDLSWEVYWQLVEVQLAVIMVSITAFRSFFVQRSNRSSNRSPHLPWYSAKRIFGKRSDDEDSDDGHSLPEIPRATLTGMRTFINGGPRTQLSEQTLNGDPDDSYDIEQNGIKVNRNFIVEHEDVKLNPIKERHQFV